MPPKPPKLKKSHRNLIIFGVAGGVLLLFMYIRSRQAQGGAADPQAIQQAAQAAAQQQSAQDAALYGNQTPSTFADNGANAAALGDAVAQGLTGVGQAFTGLQDAITQATQDRQPGAPAAPTPSPPVSISITNSATPTSQAPTPGKPAGNTPNAHTITTHPGGGFFKWFQTVYHKAPPKTILDTDPRYKQWVNVAHTPPNKNTGTVTKPTDK